MPQPVVPRIPLETLEVVTDQSVRRASLSTLPGPPSRNPSPRRAPSPARTPSPARSSSSNNRRSSSHLASQSFSPPFTARPGLYPPPPAPVRTGTISARGDSVVVDSPSRLSPESEWSTTARADDIIVRRNQQAESPSPQRGTPSLGTAVPEDNKIAEEWEELFGTMKEKMMRKMTQAAAREQAQMRVLQDAHTALREEKQRSNNADQKVAVYEGRNLDRLSSNSLMALERQLEHTLQQVRQQMEARRLKDQASLSEKLSRLEEERKCKICLENVAGVVLVPCGHRLCESCLITPAFVAANKCHICRTCVTSSVKLFNV